MLAISVSAEARKIDFKKNLFAPYVKGDIGSTTADNKAFASSSGGASFKDEVQYQYGAELGLSYKGSKFAFRAGALLLSPQIMDNIEGKNAAGTPLMNLKSTIVGVFGVGHIEFIPKMTNDTRFYISVGGGVGNITILNDYRFTTAGTAAFSKSDFTEEVKTDATLVEGAAGYEFILSDNVGMEFNLGYRAVTHSKYKHQRAVNAFQGNVGVGTDAINSDGGDRDVSLTSAFAGIGLRVYIN